MASIYRYRNAWAGPLILPNGKRRTVYGALKREVEEKLDALRSDARDGTLTDPNKLTVNDALDRYFAAPGRGGKRRASSIQTYEHAIARAREYLGPLRLQRLTDLHIEDLLAGMERDGVSDLSLKAAYKVLRSALRFSVKRKWIATNPTDSVDAPQPKPPDRKPMLDGVMPDGTPQIRRLLDAADRDESYLGPLVVLLAMSGARLGECLALRWLDLDLRAGRMTIERTLSDGDGKTVVFEEPKTRAGRRTVELPQRCVNALLRHRARLGAAPMPGLLVFPAARSGGPMRRGRRLYMAWHNMLKGAGLPRRNIHSLRHLCASLLIREGRPLTEVAARLGQTSKVLLSTYAHETHGYDQANVAALERLLG